MTDTGRVQNGVIVPDEPLMLPEGTVVKFEPAGVDTSPVVEGEKSPLPTTADPLRAWRRAAPFVPLRISTSGGLTFEIKYPEWIVVANTTSLVLVESGVVARISNQYITTIAPLPVADPQR